MRRVILAITLVIQVACGQLLLNDDERGEEISRAVNELMLESSSTSVRAQRLTPQAKHDDGEHHHHHTHVTRLDVTCDENVMRVNLEFDHPFDGVVFSKGHFGNPRCRFVSRDSARSDFSFIVSPQECGTIGEDRQAPDCDGCDDREAIIVIQNEEAVQEIWDSAKRIRCPKPKKIVKKVSFNPFEVAKLEVDELKTEETAEVECWMNIQVGNTPCGTAINGRVKIGDELSAVVYIKDNGANYDIKVKDCFAHDRADLLEKNVTSLRLSDERGCPTKKKLMGFFTRTKETCSSGADLSSSVQEDAKVTVLSHP
ncbi:hypothetical protein B566_EDAN006579 [Ephemera danica]|nr:hypothetical protein B566_EDAN006579 [Ephemera danica]